MREITIVAPRQSGLLVQIAQRMGDAGINIESIDASDVREWDIIHLVVDRYDQALQILRNAGYDAVTEDALVVRLNDEPGALASITKRLYNANLYVRSARIMQRSGGSALVAISLSEREKGMEVLQDVLVRQL